MITQKQGLANILNMMSSVPARYQFVFNWLTDINWHGEAKLIANDLAKQSRIRLEILDGVFEQELEGYLKAGSASVEIKGFVFYYSEIREYLMAQDSYHTFSYIFGFGTTNGDWESDTIGNAFIKELLEVIKNPRTYIS